MTIGYYIHRTTGYSGIVAHGSGTMIYASECIWMVPGTFEQED
jgi:hypothetical protein